MTYPVWFRRELLLKEEVSLPVGERVEQVGGAYEAYEADGADEKSTSRYLGAIVSD